MSNPSETMPHVCLLTFEHLPFLPLAIDTPVQPALNLLTEHGVLLQNFYLQQQGGDYFASQLPDHADIFVEVTMDDAQARLQQTLDAAGADAAAAGLTWIHVPLSVGMDDDPGLLALFEAVKSAGRGNSLSVVVTAVEGLCPVDLEPFESLLWESEVHVPCWAFLPDRVCGRYQHCVGSDTLLQAVADQNLPPELAGRDIHDPKSPQTLSADYLLLETDLVQAVRDQQFLFVQVHPADDVSDAAFAGMDAATALYAKPADVWNVNNLSAEFPADSERLQAQLQRRSAAE